MGRGGAARLELQIQHNVPLSFMHSLYKLGTMNFNTGWGRDLLLLSFSFSFFLRPYSCSLNKLKLFSLFFLQVAVAAAAVAVAVAAVAAHRIYPRITATRRWTYSRTSVRRRSATRI